MQSISSTLNILHFIRVKERETLHETQDGLVTGRNIRTSKKVGNIGKILSDRED